MQKEKKSQSQINQNFGTICHTEARLAAKLSELSKKI